MFQTSPNHLSISSDPVDKAELIHGSHMAYCVYGRGADYIMQREAEHSRCLPFHLKITGSSNKVKLETACVAASSAVKLCPVVLLCFHISTIKLVDKMLS